MPTLTYTESYRGDRKKPETIEELWEVLKHASDKSYPMTVSFGSNSYKILTYKSYTILGVFDLQKDGKSVQKLVKVRNGFGSSDHYNGPWKDQDNINWTADMKS